MIGVGVGVDHQRQGQAQLLQQRQVATGLAENRVNEQSLALLLVCEQIRVGRRAAVEKLSENHGDPSRVVPKTTALPVT